MKLYSFILSLSFIIFIALPGYADIYVFQGKNVVKGTVTSVSQQNNFDNYVKKAYHNPNVIQQREQLEVQKQTLEAKKKELEAYEERTRVLKNKKRYGFKRRKSSDIYYFDFNDASIDSSDFDSGGYDGGSD